MHKVLTVLSKQGCHICESVLKALNSLASSHDFEVQVVDILEDTALHDKYFLKIPVIQIDGKDVFEASDLGPRPDYEQKMEQLLERWAG